MRGKGIERKRRENAHKTKREQKYENRKRKQKIHTAAPFKRRNVATDTSLVLLKTSTNIRTSLGDLFLFLILLTLLGEGVHGVGDATDSGDGASNVRVDLNSENGECGGLLRGRLRERGRIGEWTEKTSGMGMRGGSEWLGRRWVKVESGRGRERG